MNRNQFLKNSAILGFGTLIPQKPIAPQKLSLEKIEELKQYDFSDPTNEEIWQKVQELFPSKPNFIQLEHGYFSHAFKNVINKDGEELQLIQNESSYFMRVKQEELIENTRTDLANYLGFDKNELAITRNTTESLNILFNGLDWNKNDEVIIGNQDYGSMVESLNQISLRFKIKVKIAQIPINPQTDEEIIEAYIKLITSKTKLVLLTHLINLSGQIIPIEKINQRIKQINNKIITVSDSAHSVSHISFDFKESKIDVFAGSLHKWTCCTIGLGFLKIKKELIPQIWPLFGDTGYSKDNIKKLEHFGTRPIQVYSALREAISNNKIFGSIKNKEARLRYLHQYWRNKTDLEKYYFNTPEQESRYAAIANIGSKFSSIKTPSDFSNKLWNDHKIFTVAIDHEVIKGIRITPHLSTSIKELDQLVIALNKL